jgi:hypothetical protein
MADQPPLFQLDGDLERRIGLVVAEVRATPGWPVDDEQDRRLAVELIELYPRMNLIAEIRAWRGWMADNRKRPTRAGARKGVRNWCERARRWGADRVGRRKVPSPDGGAGRTSTAPRPHDVFDQHESGLQSW